MDVVPLVLVTALRQPISEPNIEAAFERFSSITGNMMDFDGFRSVLNICLRDGLISEPVRLPEGALQCHWRLELTPKGVQRARALTVE